METTIAGVGDGRDWPSYAVKRIEDLVHLSRGVRDSVRGVMSRCGTSGHRSQLALPITKRFVERVARTNDNGKKVQAALMLAENTHALMAEMLQEIAARPEESRAELIAISGEISEQQARLQDRQRALQGEVQEVEGSMPTSTGAAIASMKQAGQAMESARTALDMGMPMQGEGPNATHRTLCARQRNTWNKHLQAAANATDDATNAGQAKR